MPKNLISLTLIFVTALAGYGQQKKVSLLFAGDAMQHKSQLDAAKTKNGYDYSSYFKHIKAQIEAVDIAVVNFETTLPGRGFTGYPCFGSPDEYAYALKDAGFDIFLTANNHCLDKGKKGLERTISVLDSMQVKHLGTYIDEYRKDIFHPMMLIKNGIRIAMLNYTYGTNGLQVQQPNVVNLIDRQQIKKDIEIARFMKPDIIIANIHWGDEYILKQNKEQESLANFLINNGVRLVIGGHPHVVQPIDIKKKEGQIENVVVYSMGNLISGMSKVNTDGGMMVRIDLSKDSKDNKIKIDNCDYSLVWVYKPVQEGRRQFQLLPVDKYNNPEGEKKIGATNHRALKTFATNAKNAVESLWP